MPYPAYGQYSRTLSWLNSAQRLRVDPWPALGAALGILGAAGGPTFAADPVAVEATLAAGLSYSGSTQGTVAVFDYDQDGDFDLIPSKHGTAPWPIMRSSL